MAVDVGSAVGYLDLDISGFLKNLHSAQGEAEKSSKSMSEKIETAFTKVGNKLSSAGEVMTATVTTPIIGAGTAAVKATSDFESAMSKVSAISGATGDDLERLTEKAKEMGAKTKFSATESAEAFQYMAMAGWKTEDMISGIDGIMALAAADGLDLATTSDIVTDALTAFGLSAKDSEHFADVLAKASSNANTNVSMMGETFKYVGALAGTMGYSIEDMATQIGLMANSGIKGSQAGTVLRSAITKLTDPTEEAINVMRQLGIMVTETQTTVNSADLDKALSAIEKANNNVEKATLKYDDALAKNGAESSKTQLALLNLEEAQRKAAEAQQKYNEIARGTPKTIDLYNSAITDEAGNIKSFSKTIDTLRGAFVNLTEQEQAQAATSLFGQEAMAGMLAIINAAPGDVAKLTGAVAEADGAAQQMADTMLNNLSGQITILKSSLEGLAIQFGEILLPYVKEFVEKIQELTQKLQNLSPEQKEQVAKWAAIVAAIGPCLLAVGKLTSGIGEMVGAFGKISTALPKIKTAFSATGEAIGGISASVIAVVAIIATLVAAFEHLWETNEEFRDKITGIWDGIKEKFETFTSGIVERLNALGFDFENITEVLKSIWEGFCNFLAPIFEGAFQIVSDVLEVVFDTLTGLLDIFIGLFTGNWEQCWNGVKEVFGGIWDGIVEIFTTILETLRNAADVVLGWFGTSWNEAWTAVGEFFVNTWNSIKEFFVNMWTSIVEGVRNFIDNVVNFFSELPYNIGLIIGKIIGIIAKFVIDMVAKAKELGKNFVESIVNFFKELPGKISDFITDAYNNVKEWAINMPARAKEAAKNFLDNVVNGIKNLPNNVKTITDNVLNNVKTWATNLANKAKEAAKNVSNNIVNGLKNLPSEVLSIGRNIVQGLWNGISGAADWLYDKVASFASGITDGIKSVLGINSPSKVAEKEIGMFLPPGIGNGFKSALPKMFTGMKEQFNNGIRKLRGKLDTLRVDGIVVDDVDFDPDWPRRNGGGGRFIDYDILAQKMTDVLRQAPISPQVNVDMQDGDVYFDNERVGRKVAPVVSRVIAQEA